MGDYHIYLKYIGSNGVTWLIYETESNQYIYLYKEATWVRGYLSRRYQWINHLDPSVPELWAPPPERWIFADLTNGAYSWSIAAHPEAIKLVVYLSLQHMSNFCSINLNNSAAGLTDSAYNLSISGYSKDKLN